LRAAREAAGARLPVAWDLTLCPEGRGPNAPWVRHCCSEIDRPLATPAS
jgi:hypothetical protein